MKFAVIGTIATAAALAACAPKADKVKAAYVSPVLYQELTCQQLASEAFRVSNAAHTAAGKENRHSKQDTVTTTAGLVIFWPALLFTHRSDATTAELAELKGQAQAIEAASESKKCGMHFTQA